MKHLLVTMLLLSLLCLGGCGLTSDVRVLKLGHVLDQQHSVHMAMEFMANRVNELSDGKLQIEIYPGGLLGSQSESLELLQLGSLDMTKVSAAVMEGFVEEYKAFGLPYIFRDRNHFFDVLDGPIGASMLSKGDRFWLRGLCFYDAGARSFYTKTRVETSQDLSGKKIRVMQSPTAVAMMRALGGSPTPISWGELYTALQGGVVDGAENNPPSFYLSRHYEVCGYYLLNEHTRIPDVLIISTHTWKDLSEQEQAWLQQAATESMKVQRELWEIAEREALAAVKAAGVVVIYPDKTPFIEKTRSVHDIYNANPIISNLLNQINAIAPADTTHRKEEIPLTTP